MKIKISNLIANEFQTRDVFPCAWRAGVVDLDNETATQMLADAQFNGDADAIDLPSHSHRLAYRALAQNLTAAFRS